MLTTIKMGIFIRIVQLQIFSYSNLVAIYSPSLLLQTYDDLPAISYRVSHSGIQRRVTTMSSSNSHKINLLFDSSATLAVRRGGLLDEVYEDTIVRSSNSDVASSSNNASTKLPSPRGLLALRFRKAKFLDWRQGSSTRKGYLCDSTPVECFGKYFPKRSPQRLGGDL
ncbi:uncharacterized protein LOC116142147 [Pistacia vera]|uniref:uncharacterized protein LOC116142147 n=1 Tax=Pistacia vera TaxID=55513 RepID=UPI0012634D06|nr:uncharacterized protein LOC116142147 [Pistacia vera]